MGIELLIKGGCRVRSLLLRGKEKLTIQSVRDRLRNMGLETWIKYNLVLQRVENSGNEYNTNIWWYRKIERWLGETLEEYGKNCI